MNVAIVGSRGFTNRTTIESAIRRWMVLAPEGVTIISGGAIGADTIGERIADELDLPKRIYRPDWNRYGRSAGFRRNAQVVGDSDVVLAFFEDGPKSPGTNHSVQLAKTMGKIVHIYHEGHWS